MIVGIAWPLLAALLLGLLPRLAAARTRPRALSLAAFLTALPTPVLAVAALLSPPPPAGGIWLQDRLALSLQLLLALPLALVTGWRLLAARSAGRTWPYWPAAAQVLTAGALVAVRSAWLFAMLAGLAIAAAAVVSMLPRHRQSGLLFAALLLTAWLGVACLTAGLGAEPGWIGLRTAFVAIPAALRSSGIVLLMLPALLLPVLLLAWTVAASPVAPIGDDDLSTRTLLPMLVGAPALAIVLRLRALPEADPALLRLDILLPVGSGLLVLLLACGLMPARRRQTDLLMLATSLQLGAASVGFGIGGAGGVVAGLMLLGGLVLALPVALLPVPTRLGRTLQRLAVLALAGLPPFVPFAAGCVLLMRVSGELPVLALLLLAGLTAGSVLLLASRPPSVAAPTGPTPAAPAPSGPAQIGLGAASVAALLALALLGWLGLAMPPGLSAWLLAASEDMAGAPWPRALPTLVP